MPYARYHGPPMDLANMRHVLFVRSLMGLSLGHF